VKDGMMRHRFVFDVEKRISEQQDILKRHTDPHEAFQHLQFEQEVVLDLELDRSLEDAHQPQAVAQQKCQ